MRSSRVVMVCLAFVACGPTSYMRATGAFSGAVKMSVEAFSAEFQAALDQCHRRQQLDVARHLMEGSENKDVDWTRHCEDVARAIDAHRDSVSAIGQYAAALQTLAAGAAYEGSGARNVATNASTVIGTFTTKDGVEAKYAAAAAEPLVLLTRFVLNQYATTAIKKAITDSAPAVRLLLQALRSYLEGEQLQGLAYEAEVNAFVANAQVLMKAPAKKVPPLEALEFVRVMTALTAEVEAAKARHQALDQALAVLTNAQSRLEAAGERDDQELGAVMNSAFEVGQAVKVALAATKTGN